MTYMKGFTSINCQIENKWNEPMRPYWEDHYSQLGGACTVTHKIFYERDNTTHHLVTPLFKSNCMKF
jgi:hypothetical protein